METHGLVTKFGASQLRAPVGLGFNLPTKGEILHEPSPFHCGIRNGCLA